MRHSERFITPCPAGLEVGNHLRHRLVTIFGLLCHHLLKDRVDFPRHVFPQRAEIGDRLPMMGEELGPDGLAFVDRLAEE